MTIKTAIKEYLVEIEIRKYTPRTVRSYRLNLGTFARFCEEQQDIDDIEDVSLATVRLYAQFFIQTGHKGTYVNALLRTVKSFIQYCYEQGYGGFNTRKNFKWCKQEKPVVRTFTPEDVKKMLKSCSGNSFCDIRDKAILTMLFETGIRCLELCQVMPEDIHDDFIVIRGKNHKERVVPVTPILQKAFLKYNRVKEAYFALKIIDKNYFLSFHGKMLTNSAVENIVKRHGEGIEDIRVSPHTCRHFFAQQQVKLGTDLYTISRLLGHENIGITQTYLNSLRDEEIIKIAKQKSILASI